MQNQDNVFNILRKNGIIVFVFIIIVALCEQTCGKKKAATTHEVSNSEYILATQDETAIHEAAHYIVYKASTIQSGCTPEPMTVSINANGSGQFVSKSYCNNSTKILTNFAGYAAVTVFYNLDPFQVFQKIQTQPDYKQAAGAIGSDKSAQYKNFLIAIEWVKTYRNSILNFSQRLKVEKTIKFQ